MCDNCGHTFIIPTLKQAEYAKRQRRHKFLLCCLFGCILLPLFVMVVIVSGKRDTADSAVAIEEIEIEYDDDYVFCIGKVRNHGSTTIDWVELEIEWLDAAGTVLETDYTVAVASEGLRPGGAKSFEIISRHDRRAERYHLVKRVR